MTDTLAALGADADAIVAAIHGGTAICNKAADLSILLDECENPREWLDEARHRLRQLVTDLARAPYQLAVIVGRLREVAAILDMGAVRQPYEAEEVFPVADRLRAATTPAEAAACLAELEILLND